MHLPHYSVLYENNPKERGTSGHSPTGEHPTDSSPFTHKLCRPAYEDPQSQGHPRAGQSGDWPIAPTATHTLVTPQLPPPTFL